MSVKRRIRFAAVAGLTLVGLSAGAYFGFQQALQHRPAFYVDAVEVPTADQQLAGKEFERNLLALHNAMQDSERWKRVFSDQQINAWLAVELPKKLPDLLPPSIRRPRVAIQEDALRIGFEYDADKLSTVVSLVLKINLTKEPNTLSVRICKAQAGWVPLPLKDVLSQISMAAHHAEIDLRWAQRDGDPVALITVPHDHDAAGNDKFLLLLLQLKTGELVVAGTSLGETE